MPTDPNWKYADTPHEKTSVDKEYKYGCNAAWRKTYGTNGTVYEAHPWNGAGGGTTVHTKWQDKTCQHTAKAADSACRGCAEQLIPIES